MTRKLFISSSEAVQTILASASGGPCGGSTAGERPDRSRCSSTSCACVYLPNGSNRRHTHALVCHVDEVEEDLLPEALGWTLSRHVVDLTVAEVHPTHVLVRNNGLRLQLEPVSSSSHFPHASTLAGAEHEN